MFVMPRMRRRRWLDATDVGADLKQVLIPADQVRQRVGELAAQIDADYAGRELLLVGTKDREPGHASIIAHGRRPAQWPTALQAKETFP